MSSANNTNSQPEMIFESLLFTFLVFLLFFICVKLLNYFLTDSHAKVLTPSKTHTWKSTQILNGVSHCSRICCTCVRSFWLDVRIST